MKTEQSIKNKETNVSAYVKRLSTTILEKWLIMVVKAFVTNKSDLHAMTWLFIMILWLQTKKN